MKRFKLLTTLIITTIGIIGITFGGSITRNGGTIAKRSSIEVSKGYCVQFYQGSYDYVTIQQNNQYYNLNDNYAMFCFDATGTINNDTSYSASYYMFDLTNYKGGCQECPICQECQECQECPAVDTGAILSGYIAISDITTNYCVSNDLCPEMSGGNSSIYINDIRHESMPFINLRIPEEIERTYNYTGNGTQLDISVEGYGYDQEKMQSMVNTQYYTPTSEEMSNLVGKIADFLPLIAIALLIVRIRRVLKKVFRF